jgi:hypothetical protein
MAEPKYGPENTEDKIGLCVEVSQFSLGKGTKTASATAGAATLNQPSGKITSESVTTAAGSTYTLTLTNSAVAATDIVQATVIGGTSTTGVPILLSAVPTANTITFKIYNAHASVAFNGTLIVGYELIKV